MRPPMHKYVIQIVEYRYLAAAQQLYPRWV